MGVNTFPSAEGRRLQVSMVRVLDQMGRLVGHLRSSLLVPLRLRRAGMSPSPYHLGILAFLFTMWASVLLLKVNAHPVVAE